MNLTDTQLSYLHQTNFIETAKGSVMSPKAFDAYLRRQGTHGLRYEVENAKSDNAKHRAASQLSKKLKQLENIKNT